MNSPLPTDALQRAAADLTVLGRAPATLELHSSLDSTMDRAFALPDTLGDEADGSIILALEQHTGRGRRGRTWSSPPGGLYLSTLLLAPDLQGLPPTLLAGLAVAEAVDDLVGLAAQVKWPNDVQLHRLKVAGILGEIRQNEGRSWLVLGIGLNVSPPPEALPPEATSLAQAARERGAEAPSLRRALGTLLARLDHHVAATRHDPAHGDLVRQALTRRLSLTGRDVRVKVAGRALLGTVEGLDASGGLIVLAEDGTRQLVLAGDVEEVRPR